MTQGHFYFISDEFYKKHDPNNQLMKNKEGIHDRPCFYAFPDTKNINILWCVPISSQIEKFEKIVKNKLDKQAARGIKIPKCNTIRFGNVMGQKRAFLIQNMFPITANYITATYIDRNTKNPVTVDPKTEKDILVNAKDILKLVFRGYNNLVFSDIKKTHSDLISELSSLQEKKTELAEKYPAPDQTAKVSMKDRFAAAQAEADRRAAGQAAPAPQKSKDDPER